MPDNIDELKEELDNPSEEEEETTEEKDEETEEEESEDEETDETPEEETEEETEEEEEEKEEEGEQFSMPEKFKGKSPEEIAKSYSALEKMIDKKAKEKAEIIINEKGKEGEDKKIKEEEDKKEEGELTKMDFSKYTPNQFANFIDKRIATRAEKIARQIISNSSKIRAGVRSDIVDARKEHPRLKEDKEYTSLVLALMEAGAAKGEKVGLKEACDRVDKLAGKDKKGENEDKIKKAKAQVELGGGPGDGGKKQTEEERIKNKLLQGSKSSLGGLGI